MKKLKKKHIFFKAATIEEASEYLLELDIAKFRNGGKVTCTFPDGSKLTHTFIEDWCKKETDYVIRPNNKPSGGKND